MTTPLDALVASVRDAASYNAAAEAPPEAVLWCDAKQEFLPLLPALRERLPELLTYRDFDAETRTGPAVWLRAALAKAVSGIDIPERVTLILYLPGVRRETLKSADDCPTIASIAADSASRGLRCRRKGRVVAQTVGIVLVPVPLAKQEQARAHQVPHAVHNRPRTTIVDQAILQPRYNPGTFQHRAHQQRSRVRAHTLVAAVNFNGPVVTKRKPVNTRFTHGISPQRLNEPMSAKLR